MISGLFLSGVGLLILGGVGARCAARSPRWASRLGWAGAVAGCVAAMGAGALVLRDGAAWILREPWSVPYGSIALHLDPLSAWFLMPMAGLGLLIAVSHAEYLSQPSLWRSTGRAWCWFDLMIACMALVLTARNGVLFLTAWEGMALSSYFLITGDSDREDVRRAGWTYLVATHLGGACLLALFALLGQGASTLDFDALVSTGLATRGTAGVLFLLALAGFGAKAGLIPFHVWLPETYPAVPPHLVALLSGAMSKLGIYGLLRVLSLLGAPEAWWGWTLVGLGILSGVVGALGALAQHDYKRVLAWSSIENLGLIALAVGVSVTAQAAGMAGVAELALAGALLHVLNHGLFKGLLFLSAGVMERQTGTTDLDLLGGLWGRMPRTGACCLVGALAIAGLPPLNGFAGEFLMGLAALNGALSAAPGLEVTALAALAGLALIAGLAAACFTRAFGCAFLGSPRVAGSGPADPPPLLRELPLMILAAACVAAGLGAPCLLAGLSPAVAAALARAPGAADAALHSGLAGLSSLVWAVLFFLVLLSALVALRSRLFAGRGVHSAETWGCGYARPTTRMQYTATAFARPLTLLFQPMLRTQSHTARPEGVNPVTASLSTETADLGREWIYAPAFRGIATALGRLRWLQHGNLQLYLLYVLAALLVLLVWKL